MDSIIKERLRKKGILFGTIITLPSSDVAEILSLAGFDWLFLDMEHGALSIEAVQNLIRAVGADTPCLVRVPANEEVWIKRCLDAGPAGVIIPHVNSEEDARRAVAFSKYPPLGRRSIGVSRASGFGLNLETYLSNANKISTVVIQIEHIDAVHKIEDIVKVEGIDALFVGPYDLSASMGKTGQLEDPEVLEAILQVKRCAQKAGLPLGTFGAVPEAAVSAFDDGFRLIAVATDTLLLGDSAIKLQKNLKQLCRINRVMDLEK
jgi:2-keto-3-deoxy-L-rhamnonate aldolase RhmA